MEKSFLENLELSSEVINQIIDEYTKETSKLKEDFESAIKYKSMFENAEQKTKQIQFDHALGSALSEAKAKNIIAVKSLMDLDSLSFNDGKIDGLDAQLDKIKAENDFLFEGNSKPPSFVLPAASPIDTEITKEQFKDMGYMQRLKLQKNDPALYEKLTINNC